MPKKTEATLHFRVGRSRSRELMLDGLHVLSISACWLSDLPIIFASMLSLLVVLSWRVQRQACEAGCVFLRYTGTTGWAVGVDSEHYLSVKIKPTTALGGMLTVLHFEMDKQQRALVIFKDAMGTNDYRKLIVNLRISGYGQG